MRFWKRKELSASHRWGLAAGGVLTAFNNEEFDQLRCLSGKHRSRSILQGSWGVNNSTEAKNMLEWLWNEGHSKPCAEACLSMRLHAWPYEEDAVFTHFVKSHLNELETYRIIGWDLSRMINVARWAYTAGYIKKELAWGAIMQAAAGIQKAYRSWEEFGEDFCLGFEYWQAGRDAPLDFDLATCLKWLTTHSQSPWRVPFNTPL